MRKWLPALPVLLTLACSDAPIVPLPNPVEPRVIRNETTDLADLGSYARAVPLETTDATLLGMVNAVKIDPATGDLLVGDYRVSKMLLRFDATGRLLRQEGRPGKGPGEYESLQAFHPLANGKLLVCGLHKLIIYDAEGEVAVERSMNLAVNWVATIGNRIYVRAVSGRDAEDVEILELDHRLDVLGRFHRRDPKLKQIIFIPRDTMAVAGDRLYLTEHYDPRLTAYDPAGTPGRSWMLPNENHLLDDRFARAEKMKQDDLFALFGDIHRFQSIHAIGERLFLLETHRAGELARPVLFHPDGGTAELFSKLALVGSRASATYLTMTMLVGHYEDGLIGICDDKARFDAAKQHHPILADIAFEETDNPVLLFFRLTERELRM